MNHSIPALCLIIALGLCFSTNGSEANRSAFVDAQGVLRWKGDNTELALFGVNYYPPFWHNYPDIKAVGADHKTVIDQDIVHLTRLGLDAIRLHVFDRQVSDAQGNLLDNVHLELLDYLILRAKERGIYTVLTPIAWWPVPGDSPGFSTRFTMQQMTTDRTSWKLQTNYLAQFVQHTNRFTGLSYREDPAVVAFELINEPLYPPDTPDSVVTEYINTLSDALRQAGNRKPVFYNGWHNRLECIRDARVDGSSFGWYPSGLVAGRSLTRDFSPQVAEYGGSNPWNPSMRHPAIARKAKIVYEFDAADIPGSYIYPAMARSFRSGGAQIATQFQYDPLPLAPFNQGWQTHYLNLVYAPQKAISFLIAAEAFRRLPRHQDYGRHPQCNRFGPFQSNYEQDLSEMVTSTEFLYSNNTKTLPPEPEKLDRIVGWGSSPIVQYEGTGAYFIEKLDSASWRLEVYPDAVWVNDPFGPHSLSREVSRLIWRAWPMKIQLPLLGSSFEIKPLNSGNSYKTVASEGCFLIRPGVYVLRSMHSTDDRWKDVSLKVPLALNEFVVPSKKAGSIAIRHDSRATWAEGVALPVEFTVATTEEPKVVELNLNSENPKFRTMPLKRARSYHYQGVLPAEWLKPGILYYTLRVETTEGRFNNPSDSRWSVAVLPGNSPVALFDAGRHQVRAQGDMPNMQQIVQGRSSGSKALQIAVKSFGPPPSSISLRTDVTEEMEPWRERLSRCLTLCIRARSLEKSTTSMEIVVLEKDGAPWGSNVLLTTEWKDIRLPLTALRYWGHWSGCPPNRGGNDDRIKPGEISGVNVCFGAWLYPGHVDEPHSIELENMTVE